MAMEARKPNAVLGLMTMGPDPSLGGRITDVAEFRSVLETFKEAGQTSLDTARVYHGGTQEAFTSQAGYKDLGLTISTKLYPTAGWKHTPADLRRALETSLDQLDAKDGGADIFYLHAPDRERPFEPALEECDRLYREGKFKRLGLSNFAAFEVAEVALLCRERGWVKPSIYQAMYNVLARGIETELVVACRRYGLNIVVYNPIAGGVFSPSFPALASAHETPLQEGRFSSVNPTGAAYRDRYLKPSMISAVQHIESTAKKYDIPLLDVALRWLAHHSALSIFEGVEGDGVILGVSKKGQLEGALKALEGEPLPEEVVRACEEGWLIVRGKGEEPNYWHGELKYGYGWK